MKMEIPFEQGEIVFCKEANFWDELIAKIDVTERVFIATYNFNFMNYEKSFYRKLATLANQGLDITLIYSLKTSSDDDKLEVEEIFNNFVLCGELSGNHSKIFLTDNFVYIGSSNFSFGSNNNYECGVIFYDLELIYQVRRNFIVKMIDDSKFVNVPKCLDPFKGIPSLLNDIGKLSAVNTIEELYVGEIKEILPNLRYIDDIARILKDCEFQLPENYYWSDFYMGASKQNALSYTILRYIYTKFLHI